MIANGTSPPTRQSPAPFGISCVMGTQNSSEVPFLGQLWAKATFKAHFEPQIRELRLTAYKGTMEAGVRVFPFRVVFTPSSPRSVATLLVVVFNEQTEYCVAICGSSAGFQGKNWGRRLHGGVPIAAAGSTATSPGVPSFE